MQESIESLEAALREGLTEAAADRAKILSITNAIGEDLAKHTLDEMRKVEEIEQRLNRIECGLEQLVQWQQEEKVERRERQLRQDERDKIMIELAEGEAKAKEELLQAQRDAREAELHKASMIKKWMSILVATLMALSIILGISGMMDMLFPILKILG